METGIQLAALVLRTVPIFQTASGRYRTASGEIAWVVDNTRKALSSKRTHENLEDFLTNLHYELSVLQMVIEKLVNELDTLTVEEKDALKRGSVPLLWTDQRVNRAVEDRLGSGYEPFRIQVTKLLENLAKLLPKDDIVLSGLEATPLNAQGVFTRLRHLQTQRQRIEDDSDFRSRFRFNIKEEKRTRILEKIARHNVKISKLLDCSTPHSTPLNESPKRPRKQLRHHRLRPVMLNLYKTMGNVWPCDCGKIHQARLCLLESPAGSDNSKQPTDKVYFNMLTSTHQEESGGSHFYWTESKIGVMLESDLSPVNKSKVTFVFDQPSSEQSPPPSPNDLSRSLTGLTYVDPPIRHERKDSKFSIPANSITPPPDVVESFHQASTPLHVKCCTKWLFDGSVLYKLQPSRDRLFVQASHPGTSLADLLLGEIKLKLRERRILAVILAHSMLHFSDSPWLSKHWNKSHLTFFQCASKNGLQLDVHRPWISTQFENGEIPENTEDGYRVHPNPSVLALGILLLEIELRAGIEQSRTEEDLSPSGEVDCNTDLFTAERLLESNCNDVFERFRKAVDGCLKCDFVDEGASTSLDDDNFRQAIYDNIVLPLEEELEIGFSLTPEDLGLGKC